MIKFRIGVTSLLNLEDSLWGSRRGTISWLFEILTLIVKVTNFFIRPSFPFLFIYLKPVCCGALSDGVRIEF